MATTLLNCSFDYIEYIERLRSPCVAAITVNHVASQKACVTIFGPPDAWGQAQAS